MIKREEFLPTRSSRRRCYILFSIVIFIYFLNNSHIKSYIDGRLFSYVIIPALWLGVISLVWYYPKVRPKGKLKLRKFLNFWSLNFGIIFIIVSVIAGLIDGLGRSPYSHSVMGILTNIVFVGSMLVGRELVRNYLLNSFTKKENYLLFIFIAFLMSITSISIKEYNDIQNYVGVVKFIAEIFAPEFSHNLFATYLVFLGGPAASIIYLGIIEGFHWLSPVLPDLKWITTGLIGVLCPIFFLMSMQSIYFRESKQFRKKDLDNESPLSWIITSILSISIIWFSVGVFPIYPSVIATGSMEPMIKTGDVILIKKMVDMEGIKQLKTGDIIQFKRDGILISHRIIEKVELDEEGLGFRTKGDNNSIEDKEIVNPEQVKGIIIKVIPKIGWPTLLIKNKDDIPLEEVVF